MSAAPPVFDVEWREVVPLRDGTPVTLRMVRPDDKELLRRGFDQLSPTSRFRRFLSPKAALSETELAYLTEIDGTDHFAIGAVLERPPKDELGVGIARFVRLGDEPEVAEPAIVVLDDVQGQGLGKVLLARLSAAAAERGVRRFRSDVLVDNDAMLSLLRSYPGFTPTSLGDGVVRFEIPLSAATEEGSLLARLLALAGKGVFRLLRPYLGMVIAA